MHPDVLTGARFAPVERRVNPERRRDGIADFTSYDVEHPV
jgi:hypothetical protein